MRVRLERSLDVPVAAQTWSDAVPADCSGAVLDLRGLPGVQSLPAVNTWVNRALDGRRRLDLVMVLGRSPRSLTPEETRYALSLLTGPLEGPCGPAPVGLEDAAVCALDVWRAPLLLSGSRLNFVVLPGTLDEVTFMDGASCDSVADLLASFLSPGTRALQGQLVTVDAGLGPLGLSGAGSRDWPPFLPDLDVTSFPAR